MFYIEKLPLKQRIITGIIGGLVTAGLMCLVYEFLDEPYDCKMPVAYFIIMGIFFGLSHKWKGSKDESTNSKF